MADLLELTEEQVFKYMRCPVQYYLEVIDKIVPPTQEKRTEIESYDYVTNTFCRELMNGTALTSSQVKRLWDKECKRNDYDMKQCTTGWGKLMQMYQWAQKIKLRILDMMMPYTVEILHQDLRIVVKGFLPIIGLTTANEPMLLIWYWNERKILQAQLDMNLKYSLWCYAFYQYTQKNIGILLHNIKHSEDVYSYRGKFDYQRLVKSFSAIGQSIHNQIWYPRESPLCTSCYLLGACRAWK